MDEKEKATEFQRRRNLPGVTVEHVDGGKRSITVELKRLGTSLGSKTTITTRGKVTQTLYVLPEMKE